MDGKTPATPETVNARIAPVAGMDVLSRDEVSRLRDASHGGLHALLRRCALAVLTSGSENDDALSIFEHFPDFGIQVLQQDRGIKLELKHAPAQAFVDGRIIRGINELLFAVVRDIAYVATQVEAGRFRLDDTNGITHAVFEILRNARVLRPNVEPNLVVCWGGHSISREEYDYTKKAGYELGLRGFDICTGCGPGAMKGPMKGATIGHAKQRLRSKRYIGITEPGIIAAESPNAIVNNLVIMPDIEKRLEAFVRTGHAIVVFPGGVGTAEEILYLLGILLDPRNEAQRLPVVLTGPNSSAAYFEQIQAFLVAAIGPEVLARLKFIMGDPPGVARHMVAEVARVRAGRRASNDSYAFNWLLAIPEDFQHPFEATHENMRRLQLHRDQPRHLLVANLRRAFSGIVAGNVKEQGIAAIEARGPFEISGEPALMRPLDELLRAFVAQGRMKLPGSGSYQPCYRVVT